MDTHTILDIISIIVMGFVCGMFGYVIHMHADLVQRQKQLLEADRELREVINPMTAFLVSLKESGLAYSEERFQAYLEQQGISPETWRFKAESLRGRSVGKYDG